MMVGLVLLVVGLVLLVVGWVLSEGVVAWPGVSLLFLSSSASPDDLLVLLLLTSNRVNKNSGIP